MTTHTGHAHGTFSWLDLSTTNTDSAKQFYASLFGWTMVDMPASPGSAYVLCKLGERVAASIKTQVERERELGAPSHWACYFAVDDADSATSRVTEAGGSIVLGPMDLRDLGRKSIVSDPTGATAMLWQAKKHIGVTVKDEPGAITWAELSTQDIDRAGAFWRSVVGWNGDAPTHAPNGTRAVFRSAQGPATGMTALPEDAREAHSQWTPYFQVTDCEAAVRKAKELGATVLAPTTEVDLPEGAGRYARLADPEGAAFGVLEPRDVMPSSPR